jgi:hypothetical protein
LKSDFSLFFSLRLKHLCDTQTKVCVTQIKIKNQMNRTELLTRLKNRWGRLDENVHSAQIVAKLNDEPERLRQIALGMREARNRYLTESLRRRFLADFVAAEDLTEIDETSDLTSAEIEVLIRKLGQKEIAVVCCGVGEVESLAPFLRRFPPADSQAILEEMARLEKIEKRRLIAAEKFVKNAWTTADDANLIVQIVGLQKLSAALPNETARRFAAQKLAPEISEQMPLQIEIDNFAAEIYRAETRRLISEIRLRNEQKSD